MAASPSAPEPNKLTTAERDLICHALTSYGKSFERASRTNPDKAVAAAFKDAAAKVDDLIRRIRNRELDI